MTTDMELTELFKRKAEDMKLSGGMPDVLTKRIKRRQGLHGMAAVAIVAALAMGTWSLSGVLASDDALPPADRDGEVVEERPPMVIDLSGIWLLVENTRWPGLLVRFSTDGTFAIDDRGLLATSPAARGTFEVDGDSITFTSEGSDICMEGDSWAWRASLVESGRLEIVHAEEAADPCRNLTGTEWTLVRVSPPSAAILGIGTPEPAGGRPPTADELAGIWFPIEAPGILFSFTPNGAFAVDNEGLLATNPDVRGTQVVKDDKIIFTIEAGGACAFGDGWAWRATLPEDGLLRIKHTKEASGNCRIARGTEWTLIRLSPGSPASAEITAN